MPAGVSWPTYLKFFTAAMFSMMAGSQIVHMYYRPLDDINELIEAEIRRKESDRNTINNLSV